MITSRYLALRTTLIDLAIQSILISTGAEWSFGFVIILLNLAVLKVKLLT